MSKNNRFVGACLATALSVAVVAPVAIPATSVAAPASSSVSVTAAPSNKIGAPIKTAAQLQRERVAAKKRAIAAKKRAKKRATIRKHKKLRTKLVREAKKRLGGRGQYVAGASSAWRFDCSGFTKYLYRKVLKRNIPHYSGAQKRSTRSIAKRNLKKGDLLFWGPGGSQHVSMYIGGGRMIGANNPRRDVVIEKINAPWWRNKYAGSGTLLKY